MSSRSLISFLFLGSALLVNPTSASRLESIVPPSQSSHSHSVTQSIIPASHSSTYDKQPLVEHKNIAPVPAVVEIQPVVEGETEEEEPVENNESSESPSSSSSSIVEEDKSKSSMNSETHSSNHLILRLEYELKELIEKLSQTSEEEEEEEDEQNESIHRQQYKKKRKNGSIKKKKCHKHKGLKKKVTTPVSEATEDMPSASIDSVDSGDAVGDRDDRRRHPFGQPGFGQPGFQQGGFQGGFQQGGFQQGGAFNQGGFTQTGQQGLTQVNAQTGIVTTFNPTTQTSTIFNPATGQSSTVAGNQLNGAISRNSLSIISMSVVIGVCTLAMTMML